MVQSLRDTGKVILKLVFLALALSFIFSRVFNREHFTDLQYVFTIKFLRENTSILFAEILLLSLNISLEALKWKYVMHNAYRMSSFKAIKGVLTGFSFGMFTPNRSGEFIGRVIMLPEDMRVKGTVASMILSVIQLSCTVVSGLAGFLFLMDVPGFMDVLPSAKIFFWSSILLLVAIIVLTMVFKASIFSRMNVVYDTLRSFRKRSLLGLFALSTGRYLVFSMQFMLALLLFGVQLNIFEMLAGVTVFFMLSTAVPSFLLSEIVTRGAVAVLIFSALSATDQPVFLASTFIWILNIAIPSLAGTLTLTFRR